MSKLRQSLQPAPASVSSMMARFLDSSLHKRLALFLLATFAFLCVANRYVGVTYDEPVYIEEASGTAAMYQAAFDQLKHLNLVGAFRTVKDSPNWDKNPMDIGFQRIYNGFVLFLFGKWAGAIWLQRGAVALAWVGLLLVLFLLGREAFGPTAGWAAMIIALGTPRLVGHGLLTCTECFLATSWMLGLWVYLRCFKGKLPIWLVGVVCGLAMMVKFQSFALLGVLSVWGFLYEPRRAVKIFVTAFPVSLLVFFGLQPLYWSHPLDQLLWLINFYAFKSTVYSQNVKGPVTVYFLGKGSINAPWFYAPVIWAVSTPLPYLALSLWGLWQAIRKFDPYRLLFLWIALLSMVLTMAPGVNVYDGERMFIQAYPAWILLAVGALSSIWEKRETWKRPILTALAAVTVFILALNFPFYMDYYGGLVGGPSGAERKGFESSYWYNAITPAMLEAINKEVPPNGGLWMGFGDLLLGYYKGAGKLRQDIQVNGQYIPGVTTHRLLYLRQGYVDIDAFKKSKAIYEVNYRGQALVKLAKAEP